MIEVPVFGKTESPFPVRKIKECCCSHVKVKLPEQGDNPLWILRQNQIETFVSFGLVAEHRKKTRETVLFISFFSLCLTLCKEKYLI